MAVKLVVLNTGDEIITDIKEALIEDVLVKYLLEKPCKVQINGSYQMFGDSDEDNFKERHSITLLKWPQLSNDNLVSVDPNSVVTVVEPNHQLKEMYENEVLKNGEIDN